MYWLVTDSTADLTQEYQAAHHHMMVGNLTYTVDGTVRESDGRPETAAAVYAAVRQGLSVSTAACTVEKWVALFQEILEQGEDILAILFSSRLSHTYQNALKAAESLQPRYPQRKIIVIDSLCASLGEGLLVDYALKNRDRDMTIEENASWVRDHRLKVQHWFTVDDLSYLRRTNRVSSTSAFLAAVTQVKPVLDVDHTGFLVAREVVAGRRRSLKALLDKIDLLSVDLGNQYIWIGYTGQAEEAEAMAMTIRDRWKVRGVYVAPIGPVIACHTGPEVVAVFFMGTDRIN